MAEKFIGRGSEAKLIDRRTEIKRTRTVIERLEVVGPMEQRQSEFARLAEEGWDFRRTGPLQIDVGQFDPTRFHFVAEREVSHEPAKP